MTDENDIYNRVLEDAYQKVTESIFTDLNLEDFDWDQLIDLIIEEDSPLQNVLSRKTVHLAALYAQARLLNNVADNVNNIGYQPDPEEEEFVETVEAEEPAKETDDFADFEDVEV